MKSSDANRSAPCPSMCKCNPIEDQNSIAADAVIQTKNQRDLGQGGTARTRRRRPACVLLSTHAPVEAPADTRHVGAHACEFRAASEKHPLASIISRELQLALGDLQLIGCQLPRLCPAAHHHKRNKMARSMPSLSSLQWKLWSHVASSSTFLGCCGLYGCWRAGRLAGDTAGPSALLKV